MKVKEFLKKHWKEILIIVFCILFLSTCAKKNNYKSAYRKANNNTEYVLDSMNRVILENDKRYEYSLYKFDSLKSEYKDLYNENAFLKEKLGIYKDQNEKLAKKASVIKINND